MTTHRSSGLSDAEQAALKTRAREAKAEANAAKARADGARAVLAVIAEMPAPDRALAERIHALVGAAAPALTPKLWYGQPAYAKDGKVICFFHGAYKYGTRYATFGFTDDAALEDGTAWPTAFGLTALSDEDAAAFAALVRKAAR